jgi:superfamily II DNA or RNA helicase
MEETTADDWEKPRLKLRLRVPSPKRRSNRLRGTERSYAVDKIESSEEESAEYSSDGPPRKRTRRQDDRFERLAIGTRKSSRRTGAVNMKEVEMDDIYRSGSESQTAVKVFGVKETFEKLDQNDPFRNRHAQDCDSCGGNQSTPANPLVYCQGCSFAYHKTCLGPRGGREHLVTKFGDENFVLQCRRCINMTKKKTRTAPNQARCQDCRELGASCAAFRSHTRAAREQEERDANNGVDPVTLVNPALINNADNVLFRCRSCCRGFHFHHLPSLDKYSYDVASDDRERAKARFFQYAVQWKCKDCLQQESKKPAGIVAWRPVNVDAYNPKTAIDAIVEDDKEYLIKWDGRSYFQVVWMPGAWVWGVLAPSSRAAFAKKNPPMKLTTETAVPEEYLRIDIVLDIEYTNYVDITTADIDRARINEVAKALIKYKGLGYEDAVWEGVPGPEDGDRWSDFVTAYNDWVLGRYITVPRALGLKSKTDKLRAQPFGQLAKKKQPDKMIGGELMKYQLDGLNWIYHQWHNQRSGILADEMGLGKTIQVIAFMAMMALEHNIFPLLVVVPNATCPNWRREIKKWAPSLRVVAFYGSAAARDLIHKYELYPSKGNKNLELRCHVVVTSYEAAADQSCGRFFRRVPWQALVVDEGQRIKSEKSQINQTLTAWKIPFRLLLTGTPLQNNARELFNLLQFLDDEINAEELEAEYKEITQDKIGQLHDVIRPFILRRTKAQVLTFLPPLAQIIVPVSMSVVQKTTYKSILSKNTDILRALISKDNQPTEKTTLNNLLMQLRKCLCHPFVYNRNIEESGLPEVHTHRNLVEASSKLQLLELLLPKLRDRGHRVLIFSQFLDMLTVMEDFLDGLEMKYQRLDGSMNALEKQKKIDEFNAPNSPLFAFLLSTRAGGVGINLATADTVIILDPDFNPHQDIQALSRAHRIGQTKKVLCFQLVTRSSAEEKIMQIGRKKMALDHVVVEQLDTGEVEHPDVASILKHGAAELFAEDSADKDIRYDDASVEKLLDRSQMENTKADADVTAESQFSHARVWANDDGAFEESLGSSEEEHAPDMGLWEKILKDRQRTAAAEAAARSAKLGRGKRKRTVGYVSQRGLANMSGRPLQ